MKRLLTPLALAALLGAFAVGCGGGGASPQSLKQQLLPVSAFPGMKAERNFAWDDPIDYVVQGLPTSQTTVPSQLVHALEDAGFEAGAGEDLVAAKGNADMGPISSVHVIQFKSDSGARKALGLVQQEGLKQPCFNACSEDPQPFTVTGIPGAKGSQLTPLPHPPPNAHPPFEAYAIAFTIGNRLYYVYTQGEPGQPKKAKVLSEAQELYKQNASSAS